MAMTPIGSQCRRRIVNAVGVRARVPLDLIARSKREKRAFAIVPGSKDAGVVAVCLPVQANRPRRRA